MTETTHYYIITTEYAGPNPRENLDADRIEIHTQPGITNTSYEVRTEGWLGQTNDWSQHAHGEYATLEDALDAVKDGRQLGTEFDLDGLLRMDSVAPPKSMQ